MGKKIHFIKEINAQERNGFCSFCGPVSLKKNGDSWACKNRYNQWKRKNRLGIKYNISDIREKPVACEICGSSERKVVFDHDHSTGKFRGWICGNCNTALGLFKENIKSMKKAIKYLLAFS